MHYRIVATLDEQAQLLRATGEMVYVNNSPDTLREMYVHQYLNAFRPGSAWSSADAREARVRFQSLADPEYGYERFTSAPTVNGVPVQVRYPGAPDSTVALFPLPRPLAPNDSVRVHFEWDARPSTLPRRQGRRGRHYDFAQWYPKVAVYDRGGWQPNALRPAGELYGEFGSYDVTMRLTNDQVVGATGIPVEGDPGWRRLLRGGTVTPRADAYGSVPSATDVARGPVPAGHRIVRFVARDVHHFAWTTSPDYLYEGGQSEDGRVAVHVLYRPGDEAQWGDLKAVRRTIAALAWLESIYGKYPYPQITNVHRLDGGGTEFPMIIMNGSASQGLILHELGHVFTYGILANNEWRSGWMDEGLTSYQTGWALGTTLPERMRRAGPAPMIRAAGDSVSPSPAPPPTGLDADQLAQLRLVLLGNAEPIGTTAHEFRDFGTYNAMIYSRAEQMYAALRDVLGDSLFRSFLRTYYDRWKLKHVDERAMRAAAEAASGKRLGWFFEQWVHDVGLIDYALRDVQTRRAVNGWVTRARIVRRGEYRHPMPVGARAGTEWVTARGDPLRDDQWVEIRTAERPTAVRLDPLLVTQDFDRRNDVRPAGASASARPRAR